MTPVATYIYLDDWTDEVLPCAPTLEGWAKWLAEPDPDWNRDTAEDSGTVYAASTLVVIADLEYRVDATGAHFGALPDGTETVFLRHAGPESGWDPELSVYRGIDGQADLAAEVGKLLATVHRPPYGDDDCGYIACTQSGARAMVRFEITDAGPVCTIEGTVQ